MESAPDLNSVKLALRGQLCVECEQRSLDDTATPPTAARCENDCTLFVNLPRLVRVAKEGVPPCGYDVFAKSLQPFGDEASSPDIAQAMTIIEIAAAASTQTECVDPGGCKRVARIATALACLNQHPTDGKSDLCPPHP